MDFLTWWQFWLFVAGVLSCLGVFCSDPDPYPDADPYDQEGR